MAGSFFLQIRRYSYRQGRLKGPNLPQTVGFALAREGLKQTANGAEKPLCGALTARSAG